MIAFSEKIWHDIPKNTKEVIDVENTIGKRIAAHRKRLGMTQEQLAEKLGITAQAVSKWENNQSCPDITAIPLLADIFQISTDVLLGLEEYTEPRSSAEAAIIDSPVEDTDGPRCRAKGELSFRITSLPLLGSAVLLMLVGILYLLSRLFEWDCTFWDILWPSTLLVFGVFGLISKFSAIGLVTACFGAFFLIYNLVPLPFSLGKDIPWFAVCCIIFGLFLLFTVFDARHKKQHKAGRKEHTNTYEINGSQLRCSSSFGEQRQLVTTDLLSGGSIANSFGEYIVDLSGVEAVADNCLLNASCSFGELKILIPKRYAVAHQTSTMFAGFSVDGTPDEMPAGYIQIKAAVNFGEIRVEYI